MYESNLERAKKYYRYEILEGCLVEKDYFNNAVVAGYYQGKEYRYLVTWTEETPHWRESGDGYREIFFSWKQRRRLSEGFPFGELVQEVLNKK